MVVARGDVTVESEADGVQATQVLRPGETITLMAVERLVVSVDDAGLAEVSVAGKDATEGVAGLPHTYRFTAGDGGDTSSNE